MESTKITIDPILLTYVAQTLGRVLSLVMDASGVCSAWTDQEYIEIQELISMGK